MKLGLINPTFNKETLNRNECFNGADVFLPRRVAMHCKGYVDNCFNHNTLPSSSSTLPKSGIFQIAASQYHSVVLVRRANNSIELYSWGKRMDSFSEQIVPLARSNNIYQGVPTLVESLSCEPSSTVHPTAVALGLQCTLILTSDGNIFSLGKSADGLLGLGTGVS